MRDFMKIIEDYCLKIITLDGKMGCLCSKSDDQKLRPLIAHHQVMILSI